MKDNIKAFPRGWSKVKQHADAPEVIGIAQQGMDLRDVFAGLAPTEIPEWFEYTKPEEIDEPAGYWDLKKHPDYSAMKYWHNGDSIIDFPQTEALNEYKALWISHRKQKNRAIREAEEITYFRWRYYYADQMMKRREAPNT